MINGVKLLWVCWLATELGACRPNGKALPAAAVLADTVALAGKVDSSHQVKQDGLDYAPLNTGTYRQLPPEVTEILNQQYPGWVLPELSEAELKQVTREAQGPYFVQADFDRNGLQDFAVKFQVRDSTLVTAYLRQPRQPPIKFVLLRQPLPRGRGQKQSPVVVSKDSTPGAGNGTEATRIGYSQEGIAIGMPHNRRVFVFNKGLFSLAPAPD
jgi:hypothetical protein